MPLTLPSFNFAIICDENELETYDVKQEALEEGPDSITAFVASEAGKVSVPNVPFVSTRKTNCRNQQFRVVMTNNLSDFDLCFVLHIDGKRITSKYLRAGHQGELWGIRNSDTTRLPFKFQELELVGAFPRPFHGQDILFSFTSEDPDLEHAPVSPEMGTIELRAFRCQAPRLKPCKPRRYANYGLHQGSVSERSKKAGWHHVRYSTSQLKPPVQFSSTSETH